MGVLADELADLVHQEANAVVGAFAVEILPDPAGKVLHGQERLEVVLGLVEPGPCTLWGLAKRVRQGLDQLVGVEAVTVPLLLPIDTGDGAKDVLERLQLALSGEVSLQFGDVRVVPAVTELFVEDLEKHPEDGVTPADAVGGRHGPAP